MKQTMSHTDERSYERIEPSDLDRLVHLAHEDLEGLYSRRSETTGKRYRDRLILMCLCQGAAQHYLDGKNGIKDFDVWAFFSPHPDGHFPYRRTGKMDFGPSRFGRHPDDDGYKGRRVDVLGRSIPYQNGQDYIEAVRQWLRTDKNKSPRLLAERPVIALDPLGVRGCVIWDPMTC